MADFLHYAGLTLLCVATGGICLAPLLIPGLIRRADAGAAAKLAQQQSAPSPIKSKETRVPMFRRIRESFARANETVRWAQEVAAESAPPPRAPKPAPRRPTDTEETGNA